MSLNFPKPPEWTEQARCSIDDADVFYPSRDEISSFAVRICAGCPVKSECLQYALEMDERHGVWGGLTPQARNKIRRAAA